MKIALVNSEYPSPSGIDQGGIATYTYTLAHNLARHGHTVHVLTRSGLPTNRIDTSVHFHDFRFTGHRNIFIRLLGHLINSPDLWEKGQANAAARVLAEIASRDGLDITEFPEYGGLSYYCPVSTGVATVVTFHTPTELVDSVNGVFPAPAQKRLYRFESKAISRADIYTSPSQALKTWVCEKYRIPESLVTVIRNPLDSSPIQKIHISSSGRSDFDILFTGRLERRKGAELILHSIKDILSIDQSISFTIAGETEIAHSQNYRHAIERILSSEERKRVWFPGPLSRSKLLPLYQNSSLFLFPSLFENAPYALMEALAAGLPVIASDRGGIKEIIIHGKNGLLFSPDNPSDIVTHISTLFHNKQKASSLSQGAIETIRNDYDPDTIVGQHLALYQSVINSHNQTS